MPSLLIASTDTDCGKTVLTCALVAYWQRYCQPNQLGLLKPVQSGVGDRELYLKLFDLAESVNDVNPVFYEAPLAPPIAARLQNQTVDLVPAWQAYEQLRQTKDWVIVEGLGGLGSPVTDELTVADIAATWRLPLVLVVPVKLGAIANAVANVALARQKKLNLRGIVLNCVTASAENEVEDKAPPELIERLTQIPILGVLPYLNDPQDLTQLQKAAQSLTLEALMPKPFWT